MAITLNGSGVSTSAVSATGAQTLTNKTLNLTSNTLLATLAQLNTAITDANIASIAGAETLTSKTIDAGILTGTLTAGGSVGSNGQFLTSTGTGVQYTTIASVNLASIETTIAMGAY